MSATGNDTPRPPLAPLDGSTKSGSWQTPPATLAERLQRIDVMSQRIDGYIQFFRDIESLNGSSAEAKERAVIAFYERMLIVERQLGRIQEDLRLE